MMARHSGLVLDVYEFNENDGADIVQWQDGNTNNQQFRFEEVDNSGYVRIVNRLSNKALAPEQNSNALEARITQYTPSFNTAQQWQLVEVDSYNPPGGEVGECGTTDAEVIVTGQPGNYLVNGTGVGGDFSFALQNAIRYLNLLALSQK